MNSALADLARFAGVQFRSAFLHLKTHGFVNTALGTTVTRWLARHHLHVLQTDNPAYVETMGMNWLHADHKNRNSSAS